jgi:RHS repeat-associated protein
MELALGAIDMSQNIKIKLIPLLLIIFFSTIPIAGADVYEEWNFATTTEGWTSGGTMTSITQYAADGWPGIIYADCTGSDPQFISPTINEPALSSHRVTIRIATYNGTTHEMRLYWKRTGDASFDQTRSVAVNYSSSTGQNFQTVEFNVGANSNWNGTITQLRIDPSSSECPATPYRFHIDSISLQGTPPDFVAERAYMFDIDSPGVELTDPKVGDVVQFAFEYRLDGCNVTDSFTRKCYLDNTLFSSAILSDATAGTTYYPTTPETWTVTAGYHHIRWEIDADSQINESSESNNTATNSWDVENHFDLRALSAIVVDSNGVQAVGYIGQTVYFKFNYEVIGQGTTPSFDIICNLNGSSFFTQNNITRNGGQTYAVTTTNGFVVTDQTHTVQWILDYNAEIAETNETNNTATTGWTPSGPPNITVTYPNGGETLFKGQNYTITWDSTSISGNVKIEVYKGGTMHYQLAANDPNDESCPFTPDANFPDASDYRIAITAIDEGVSDYSDAYFSIISTPPAPELIFPPESPPVTDKTLTFDWSDVPGAVSYEIIVDNNPGLGSPEIHEPGNQLSQLTNSTYAVTNWLDDNTYYWKVIAHFSDESTIESGIGSFTYHLPVHSSPVWVPFYRLYKSSIHDHFYTTIPSQRDIAVANSGYTYEKIEGYISDRKYDDANCIPIFRLYHSGGNVHFYTSDSAQKDTAIVNGYLYEGIVGFISSEAEEALIPLFYLQNQSLTDNFYTISRFEADNAVVQGFSDNGVIGYLSPTGIKEPEAHKRPQANFGGVDLGSGAFRGLNSLDLAMKGRGPSLKFSHYYNSFNFNQEPMGMGWSHNYDAYIHEVYNGTEVTDVIVYWGNGTLSTFSKDTGIWNDNTGQHDIMELVDDGINYGYNIRKKNQTVYQFRMFTINLPNAVSVPAILLIKIEDWAGNSITIDHEASSGRVQKATDTFGREHRFEYSLSNQLTRVAEYVNNTEERAVSFSYNADGLLETFTNAENKVTTYAYDMADTARKYHLKTITYPELNVIHIGYDEETGQVLSIQPGDDSPSAIRYEPANNKTMVTDPRSNAVFTYVHEGFRLTSQSGPDLNDAKFEYSDTTNNPNKPTRIVDKEDNATEFVYDAMGNVKKITNADGKEALFTYNTGEGKNNLTSSTLFHANGATITPTVYTYDTDGNRLISIENPEHEITNINYDPGQVDQVASIQDGRGYFTHFTYDAYGNLETVTDAEGNTTTYANDYAGRTTQVTDAENFNAWYTFDKLNNLKTVKNHYNHVVNLVYNDNGLLDNINWLNQGQTAKTEYAYDNEDRLQSVKDPLNLTETFTYYNNSLLNTRTDAKNITTTYDYDDNNRLETVAYPDHTTAIIRDKNGSIRTVTNQAGTPSTFVYNNLNMLSTYTDPFSNTVSYDYNDAGQISRINYPGVFYVDYTYDDAGRLETVADSNNGKVTYVYDNAGNLTEAQRSVSAVNTIKTVYSYDNASRLTGIAEMQGAAALWSYTYDLDGVGNHNSVDAVDEPLTGTIAAEDVAYTHDPKSNRLLTAGGTTYTYDNNGNRQNSVTDSITTTYTWDNENRLTGISTPGQQNITYTYDGMGNRIARTVGATTTWYALDLNSSMSRVLAETDASNNVIAWYVYGHGLVSRVEAGTSERRFYHFNHRGDTIALSDDSGSITDKYAYGEYGRQENSWAATTPTSNPFTYVGQYGVINEGNDLYFMRARFYDAAVGRFLSEDPIGFSGGDWNFYLYVGANPIIRTDPKGAYWLKTSNPLYKLTGWADNRNLVSGAKIVKPFFTLGASLTPPGAAMAIGINAIPTVKKMFTGELSSTEAFTEAALLGVSLGFLKANNYLDGKGMDWLYTRSKINQGKFILKWSEVGFDVISAHDEISDSIDEHYAK